MSEYDRELHRVAMLLRNAAEVERAGGKTGRTLEVLDEVLRALPRMQRERFAAEVAAYLARALVAAIARGRGGSGR